MVEEFLKLHKYFLTIQGQFSALSRICSYVPQVPFQYMLLFAYHDLEQKGVTFLHECLPCMFFS